MKTLDIMKVTAGVFAKKDNRVSFAGSSFIFNHENKLLICTADHVIAGHEGSVFEIVTETGAISTEIVSRNAGLDLCILRPINAPAGQPSMALSNEIRTPGNITLYAYEYSTTEIKDGKWNIHPATRIGNCVRMIQREDIFREAGKDMLELSFPALRGASGSAVIEIKNGAMIVHGIIVANTEHHLLPAHIETVLDEKNDILEERKYFLPQGAAVNSVHLLSMLNNLEM